VRLLVSFGSDARKERRRRAHRDHRGHREFLPVLRVRQSRTDRHHHHLKRRRMKVCAPTPCLFRFFSVFLNPTVFQTLNTLNEKVSISPSRCRHFSPCYSRVEEHPRAKERRSQSGRRRGERSRGGGEEDKEERLLVLERLSHHTERENWCGAIHVIDPLSKKKKTNTTTNVFPRATRKERRPRTETLRRENERRDHGED
jgi:hypothetical protein